MPDEKHATPPMPGGESSDSSKAARPRSTVSFQGVVVAVLTAVVGALVTQNFVEAPKLRAQSFAADVHSFNLLQDNARTEFAAAADDQRDEMIGLIRAMLDGNPPKEVLDRTARVKSKFEAYQRAAARLQALQRNYGPVFTAESRTMPVRDLGTQLLGLHYFEQGAMIAASRFKDCLVELAEDYQRSPYAPEENQRQVRCRYAKRQKERPHAIVVTAYLLNRANHDSQAYVDIEQNGELGHLDDCEAAIELKLSFITASLASEVEAPGSPDTALSAAASWIGSKLGEPPPQADPVKPPSMSLEDGCGAKTADEQHIPRILVADRLGAWTEERFHPRPETGAAGPPRAPAKP